MRRKRKQDTASVYVGMYPSARFAGRELRNFMRIFLCLDTKENLCTLETA